VKDDDEIPAAGSDEDALTERQYFNMLEKKRQQLLAWLVSYKAGILAGNRPAASARPGSSWLRERGSDAPR
jgi:hypothetical protein